MKVNWSIIGGFCLGSFASILLHEAYKFFPEQPDQGWACVVMFIFTCIVTASHAMEKS